MSKSRPQACLVWNVTSFQEVCHLKLLDGSFYSMLRMWWTLSLSTWSWNHAHCIQLFLNIASFLLLSIYRPKFTTASQLSTSMFSSLTPWWKFYFCLTKICYNAVWPSVLLFYPKGPKMKIAAIYWMLIMGQALCSVLFNALFYQSLTTIPRGKCYFYLHFTDVEIGFEKLSNSLVCDRVRIQTPGCLTPKPPPLFSG